MFVLRYSYKYCDSCKPETNDDEWEDLEEEDGEEGEIVVKDDYEEEQEIGPEGEPEVDLKSDLVGPDIDEVIKIETNNYNIGDAEKKGENSKKRIEDLFDKKSLVF